MVLTNEEKRKTEAQSMVPVTQHQAYPEKEDSQDKNVSHGFRDPAVAIEQRSAVHEQCEKCPDKRSNDERQMDDSYKIANQVQ